MALDFGLLGDKSNVQSSDYKSAGSHQAENLKFKLVTNTGVWREVYVVTTGKTYYVSGVVIAINLAIKSIARLGVGAGGSEEEFMVFVAAGSADNPTFVASFPTPIKFASGTRIAAKTTTDEDVFFSLIGWEE